MRNQPNRYRRWLTFAALLTMLPTHAFDDGAVLKLKVDLPTPTEEATLASWQAQFKGRAKTITLGDGYDQDVIVIPYNVFVNAANEQGVTIFNKNSIGDMAMSASDWRKVINAALQEQKIKIYVYNILDTTDDNKVLPSQENIQEKQLTDDYHLSASPYWLNRNQWIGVIILALLGIGGLLYAFLGVTTKEETPQASKPNRTLRRKEVSVSA